MSTNRRGGGRGKVGRPINLIRQNHFVRAGADGKWCCKHCQQIYASNTASGNLTNHMKRSHSDKLTVEDLGIKEYENVSSCPPGMMNMGFSADQPSFPSTPMPDTHSLPPQYQQIRFQPSPSFQQNSPLPNETQTSPFFLGNGEHAELINYTPISHLQSFDYQPNRVVTTYDHHDVQLQSSLPNNFNIYSHSLTPTNKLAESSNMDIEQSMSDVFRSISSIEISSSSKALEIPSIQGQFQISNITPPPVLQSRSEFETQLNKTAVPINDTVVEVTTISDKSRKRKFEISVGSAFELKAIVEDLIESGRGKDEIRIYVEKAILENPILFHAFLRKPNDTLQMIDSRFGQISLSLLGDGPIGQRKDAIKQILFEQCNRQWNPCLFQVYLFPFKLQNKLYCTVELGFQNLSSQRRSCILDCIEIPFEAHKELIGGAVVTLLKNFGVQSKLSEVSIRGKFSEDSHATGSVLERNLTEFLREEIKVKDQRLKIKLSSNLDKDYNKRVREYFEVPGIDHSDETFRLQMKLAEYDSLISEMKILFPTAVEKAKTEIANDEQLKFDQTLNLENNFVLPYCSSIEVKQAKVFIESVTNKLKLVQCATIKLKKASSPIESSLFRISKDSKYYIYYLPTNTREKLNLLRLVPLLPYENELENVNRLLRDLVECVNRYMHYSESFTSPEFSVDELTEYFNLVEIDSKDLAPVEYDLFAFSFDDWDAIYKQGLRIYNQYFDICEYLVNMSSNWIEMGIKSYYVKELKKLNKHTPADIPFEKFKKLAFLKAWKTFEETFNNK